jgi:hypothetical protein
VDGSSYLGGCSVPESSQQWELLQHFAGLDQTLGNSLSKKKRTAGQSLVDVWDAPSGRSHVLYPLFFQNFKRPFRCPYARQNLFLESLPRAPRMCVHCAKFFSSSQCHESRQCLGGQSSIECQHSVASYHGSRDDTTISRHGFPLD